MRADHVAATRRLLAPRVALGFACLISACGGGAPTSPTQAGVVGLWHGVSVVQTAGEVTGGFSREDITLRVNGSADIVEYEGSRRSDAGTWSLSGNAISIDFLSFCDRRGTVNGNTMNLTCTLDTRTWALVYEKQ